MATQQNSSAAVQNLLLEKKGKLLGLRLTRQVTVRPGIIQQAGSGGGCFGAQSREFPSTSSTTVQERHQVENQEEWAPEAATMTARLQINFAGQQHGDVFIYTQDKKQALLVQHLLEMRGETDNAVTVHPEAKHDIEFQERRLGAQKAHDLMPSEVKAYQIHHQFVKLEPVKRNDIATQIIAPKEKKFQTIMQQQGGDSGQPYTDPQFPPELSSITQDQQSVQKYSSYIWKRATEFCKGPVQVFLGKIEPNDIRQGQLGDCYFLSSLSSLAEDPILIEKLFITKNANDKHCYSLWLNIDGAFEEFLIDDYFPCHQQTGQPAFSKGNGDEIWVMLLEKAYAKAYGGYHKIESGLTGNAIRDLSGAPFIFKETSEGQEAIWQFVATAKQSQYILTAGSQQSESKQFEQDLGKGIVSSHAYAILNVHIANGERILQLRNPWGKGEWKGDWSDESNKWTPALKQELGWSDADDGIFWIRIDDFCRQFEEVTVSQLHQDYRYTFQKLPGNSARLPVLIPFVVESNNTHAFIEISQRDKRHYQKSSQHKYGMLKLVIVSGDLQTFVGESSKQDKSVHVQGTLQSGTYIAYIDADWGPIASSSAQQPPNFDAKQIVISSYSSAQIVFADSKKQVSDPTQVSQTLDKILVARPPAKPTDLLQYSEDPKVSRVTGNAAGFVYFAYTNHSTSSTLKESITLKDRQYLEICPPDTNSNKFTVEVHPQEVRVAKFRILPEGRGAFSYKSSIQTEFSYSDEALIKKIKEKPSSKRQRQPAGTPENIFCYTFFTSNGAALYWENLSSKAYYEDCQLKLTNLQRDGTDKSPQLKIHLPAGGTLLVKLTIVDESQSYSVGTSYTCRFE